MKLKGGFTLIELMIVIVIIGVLAVVSVPMYRGYVRKAMASEGVALAGSIRSAERVYMAEHTVFIPCANWAAIHANLDLDQPDGKYFNAANCTGDVALVGAGFLATITSTGGEANGIIITITDTGVVTKAGL